MDLRSLLRRSAVHHRDRPAVLSHGTARTYAELDERARRLANGLAALGLVPGDRVGVILDNRMEFPEVDVGIAYGGFVRVAVNARLGPLDHEFVLTDSEARAVVTDRRTGELMELLDSGLGLPSIHLGGGELPSARAVDYESFLALQATAYPTLGDLDAETAWISYTSGTTGRPKGVELSNRALVHTALNLVLELGPRNEDERILLPQPLSHGAGYFVLAYLASGAAVHPVAKFDPDEAMWLGEQERIDTLKLVPTMLNNLLDTGTPSPFRRIVYGASPIALPHLERALDAYGPVLFQVYGQSEAPMTITCLRESDHARPGRHRTSAGRPWRSVEVRIVDSDGHEVPPGTLGQVAVRGEHLMTGYLGRPDLTAEVLRDGWLWTKDLGEADEDGFVYLHGRSDDMIISGGFNIAPREVEDALLEHPDLQGCVVAGHPDPVWGQTVCAYVELVHGSALTADDLIAFAAPRLGYRKPRRVVVVDELPVSLNGKIDRKELLRRFLPPVESGEGLSA